MSRRFYKLYFPGLISLVGLPIMCIWYLISIGTFHKYRAMHVAWLDSSSMGSWMKFYNNPNLLTFRKYQELQITGDASRDSLTLNKLKIWINQLQINNDTINGIKVAFKNSAKYNDLVDVLDRCFQMSKSFGFQPFEDEIYIFYNTATNHVITALSPHFYDGRIIYKPQVDTNLIDKIEIGARDSYKILWQFWPSVLGYTLMLFFTIFKKHVPFAENR